MIQRKPSRSSSTRGAAALVVAAALFAAGPAGADDRDLLRESSSDPLVFILFDTSGSMHWTPQCTQEQFDAGVCDYLCPTGDCFPSMSGDDPASKLAQAKEALHEVLSQVDGIHFGFATYNQDGLRMRDKHWLYRVSDVQVKPDGTPNYLVLSNLDHFPDVARRCTRNLAACTSDADCGARGGTCEYEDVFGATWPCDEGTGIAEKACYANDGDVADMDDTWELRRAQLYSKLGRGPDFSGVPSGQFRDRFNADSFNNDDGALSWSGAWIEDDHPGGAGPTLGNARISGGKLRLDDYPNEPGKPSLARQADLSSFTTGAELAFDWQVVGNVERADAAVVEVSSNGGVSWTTLETFDNFRNPASGSRTYDISAYTSATTRVRFRITNEYHGDDEEFRVDDLEVRPLNSEAVVYLRNPNDSRRYKFIYRPVPSYFDGTADVANRYGNPTFAAEIEVRECTDFNDDCASDFVDKQVILYDLVDEFAKWDIGADRGPRQPGFFDQSASADGTASNTCAGWDGNEDDGADPYPDSGGYRLRWPTDPNPPPLRFDTNGDGVKDLEDFLFGDLIPLDWEDDHKAEILQRLAPNTVGNPAATPDFGVASYFRDQRAAGEDFLRLENESRRPIVADGSTPLGNAIKDFRTWYSGCPQGNCPNDTGWSDVAAFFDRDFNCRKKFLMVLTDGDNTCNGPSACSGTASLRAQTGIKTFVVAFGVQGGGNTLTCMAANGGTGEPVYPQNKQELVDALLELFTDIKVESRAFASASVPTVQNETSDKIFLSSFTPLPEKSVWPGRLNAFRKPLPLTVDDLPDFDRDCKRLGLQSACHLWDAAYVLSTTQAPSDAELAADDYRLGPDADERRILYSRENLTGKAPTNLRLFVPPDPDTAEETDLWEGLGLGVDPADAAAKAAARVEVERIVSELVKIKTASVPDPNGGPDLEFAYVLGDIFHADPRVLGSPNDLIYFRQDLHGYQDFSSDHFWRRKMLVVGANDGQLHFFDAGVRTVVNDLSFGVKVARFTDGTGRELFSYVPRMVLPIVKEQAGTDKHIYSLDGIPVSADVHIDPKHDATIGDPPDPDQREWRTVLIGGLREGGDVHRRSLPVSGFVSGYYALDVTQPDVLEDPPDPFDDEPNPKLIPKPGPVPPGEDPADFNQSPPLVPTCLRLTDADQTNEPACTTSQGEPYPFPSELWTFTDRILYDVDSDGEREVYYLDEEADVNGNGRQGNGERDLGDTWSKPVLGRIRVCAGSVCDPAIVPNDLEERYVAIFGGGIDPRFPDSPVRGAWLYMVDIETGLAIYKRQLAGAAAAAPAALDRDRDGFLDLVYVATTNGLLYKVTLAPGTSTDLGTVTIRQESLLPADPGVAAPASVTVERITTSDWDPLLIFTTEGKPIYMTPTAFVVPDLQQFALSFGTGNRHNLWNFDGTEGRLYTFVDEDYDVTDAGILPRREADYAAVTLGSPNAGVSFLLDRAPEHRGWFIVLGPNEKVITQTFALVGVLVFTAFDPQEATDQDGDGFVDACARSGVSRVFVVDAENADAFADLDDDTATLERYHLVGDFTTSIYVDETATKNPDVSGRTTESQLDPKQEALQEAIRQALMRFFPKGCRYNKSYSLTVNASRSDTGHVRYATIPIAMCPVDWKED